MSLLIEQDVISIMAVTTLTVVILCLLLLMCVMMRLMRMMTIGWDMPRWRVQGEGHDSS